MPIQLQNYTQFERLRTLGSILLYTSKSSSKDALSLVSLAGDTETDGNSQGPSLTMKWDWKGAVEKNV